MFCSLSTGKVNEPDLQDVLRLVHPGIPLTRNTLAEEPALRLLSEYICQKRKEARILRQVKSSPEGLSSKDK